MVKFILFSLMQTVAILCLTIAIVLCSIGVYGGGILMALLGIFGTNSILNSVYKSMIS